MCFREDPCTSSSLISSFDSVFTQLETDVPAMNSLSGNMGAIETDLESSFGTTERFLSSGSVSCIDSLISILTLSLLFSLLVTVTPFSDKISMIFLYCPFSKQLATVYYLLIKLLEFFPARNGDPSYLRLTTW